MAVLPDSGEAVRIAQTAGELAVASGRPLALVVPLPSTGFTLDPAVLALRYSRVEQDTAAIAGRVLPEAVVLSAASPALPHMRIPAEVLHLVKPAAHDTSQDVAHPVPGHVSGR